jgi:hypothetical protein
LFLSWARSIAAPTPIDLYCDNSGAIAQAKEPKVAPEVETHTMVLSFDLRNHRSRRVKICKVHIDLNVADPLTKLLPQAKHDAHTRVVGMRCWHD